MTSHPYFTDRLSESLDGRLSPMERAELETHLENCAACREYQGDLERQRVALKAIVRSNPPESFYSGVWARIDASQATNKRWTFLSGTPAKIATGLALVFIVVLTTRQAQKPELDTLSTRTAPSMERSVPPSVADKPLAVPVVPMNEVFEEVDEKQKGLRRDATHHSREEESNEMRSLYLGKEVSSAHSLATDLAKPVSQSSGKTLKSLNGALQQARDIDGIAAQNSFPPVSAQTRLGAAASPSQEIVVSKDLIPVETKKKASLGDHSNGVVVIQSQDEWDSLWQAHRMAGIFLRTSINFRETTAIVIFAPTEGPKNSVLITRVVSRSEAIEVDYELKAVVNGEPHPFQIRILPKTTLPVNFVKVSN